MTDLPTFGVEEEFLLVDHRDGAPVPRNQAVAEYAAARGVDLQLELTRCQVETTTAVMSTSGDLRCSEECPRKGHLPRDESWTCDQSRCSQY